MPKSSRHKSSRHSVREAREYSDTERESGLKERKGREDGGSGSSNRHLKDSTSGEKRKFDLKSVDASKELGDVEYTDANGGGSGALSLTKKRREKVQDDRWTGGDIKEEHELSKSEMKKEKEEGRGSGDSRRSSRREESRFDVQEGRKSGSKVESKHHRSEKKERGDKEGVLDRERRGSRCDRIEKSERLVDIVSVSENAGSEVNKKQGGSGEERVGKHGAGNTDCNMQEGLQKLEPPRDSDRRVRRKKDGSGDGDRQGGVRDPEDRRLSSREEIAKYGKSKDDAQKDERNRGQFQEDIYKDNWHHDEKQQDNRPTRDHNGGRSDDKHLRNEKKDLDVSQKKLKPHSREYDREVDRDNKERDRDRDYDWDRGRNRDRDRSRQDYDCDREHVPDRERDLEHVNGRDHKFDRDREYGRDRYQRERDRDRVHDRGNDGGHDRDFDRDLDYASHADEKASRYKDDRGRQRSLDAYDGYYGDKVRRTDSEVDKDRSLSRKSNADGAASSSRRWASPTSRAYVAPDKYRDGIQDVTKYVDSVRDSTMSEALDKVPKYRSGEKRSKFDENHIGEFSEKSPSTKASPAGLKERSPSSSCFERSRFPCRSSRRRSLEFDEVERRSSGSNDMRDISAADDRQSKEISARKSMGDDYPSSDPSMYHKSGQGNVSSQGPGPGPSVFRSGADSPSVGSFGEDSRGHSGSRYRRSVDPNLGRGPVNSWNGVPNWPSALPNGFMPFPPGPPGPHHGGFPPILSQFPPPFGVRPSLDMNHPGLPYHMTDGDRFPGHVRPLGWPNMVDGSIPPHFPVWDGGNGIFREDPGMFGPGHLGNAQRRDMNADIWKQYGDVNAEVTSGSQKGGHTMKASADEASSALVASGHNVENSGLNDQGTSLKKDTPSVPSPMKDPMTPAKLTTEKTPESLNADDIAQSLRAYLAKLDISVNLADPELYNQFIDLAVEGQSENIEENLELEYTEEKAIVESEITNLSVDLKLFPVAEDSIFQRAMDLYKAQSTDRRSFRALDGDKLCTIPAQPEVEQATLEVKVETAVVNVNQEQQTPAGSEDSSGEVDSEEPVCTGVKILNDGPFQSSELPLDVGDESQIPVLDVEMEADASMELASENVDNGILTVESIVPDATGSNADKDVVTDGDMTNHSESAPGELLDVTVSSPLFSPHDSVRVREPLIPVSDGSESVILSRIHHAPESTH